MENKRRPDRPREELALRFRLKLTREIFRLLHVQQPAVLFIPEMSEDYGILDKI
jgi:hypothetical protein